jgi:hypothetical protein
VLTWRDRPFLLDAVRVALHIPRGDLPWLTRRYLDAVCRLGAAGRAAGRRRRASTASAAPHRAGS